MSPPAVVIAPSILSADFARLGDEVARMQSAGADWLHVDVMDGHFVPNLTIGPPVVKALRKVTTLPLDCHLMIEAPNRWVGEYLAAGADGVTFHVEAEADPRPGLQAIRDAGKRAALALRPRTPVEALFPYLDLCDMVLVMTVEPGFGGQAYMADMAPKIAALRARAPGLDIQVDGGLDPTTVKHAAAQGANVIVAGSAVFRAPDAAVAIAALRSGAQASLPS